MAILSFQEIKDMIFMTLVVGFIFTKLLERARMRHQSHNNYDPLKQHNSFDLELFKKAMIIAAPAIIFHEFGHKFVAMAFGASATFHAAYIWLGFGALLAAMNTGIIFFVPAYVSISTAILTPLQMSLVAFAGPAVNAIIWGFSAYMLKSGKVKKKAVCNLVFNKTNKYVLVRIQLNTNTWI